MQSREDPFQSMMGIDRLAVDLHRLGDRLVTELRKCVIIVAKLFAVYEIEVRMLENNPTGLETADIERVVRNRYNRFLRQQHDSKALSASGGTTTADRGEKKKGPRNRFDGNCFNCGRKSRRAEDAEAQRRSKNHEMPPPTRSAEVGKSSTSVGVRGTFLIYSVACAKARSTGLAVARGEELRRVRY